MHELIRAEQKIVEFIRGHAGCSKADVVRYMEKAGPVSRITTLNYIENLQAEEIIICKLEKPNSQIYRIYINEENKLASLLGELEDFKEAYFRLLQKSKERINGKDYSVAAKKLRIEEPDPSRWQMSDKLHYAQFEIAKLREGYERLKESIELIVNRGALSKSRDLIKKITDNLSESDMDMEEAKNSLLRNKQLLLDANTNVIKLKSTISDAESVLLAFSAVFFFYIFREILFFRSTIVWPNTIQDRESLINVNSTAYTKIVEIQLQLSQFLRSIKIDLVDADPIGFMQLNRYFPDRDPTYDILLYQILGMESEMQGVINSILKVNEEIKEFKYLNIDKIMRYLASDMEEEVNECLKAVDDCILIVSG